MTLIEKFLTSPVNLESMSIAYHDQEVENYRCDETPLKAVIFASTGSDGVHFCVVPKEGVPIDESPVYMVSPSDSEDTVVWVAKNFTDFLSIGAEMGSFLFIPYIHTCNKKEFNEIYEDLWADENEEKKAAIKELEAEFTLRKFDNSFQHIKTTYKDKENHTGLKFLSRDIKLGKPGHYNKD